MFWNESPYKRICRDSAVEGRGVIVKTRDVAGLTQATKLPPFLHCQLFLLQYSQKVFCFPFFLFLFLCLCQNTSFVSWRKKKGVSCAKFFSIFPCLLCYCPPLFETTGPSSCALLATKGVLQ